MLDLWLQAETPGVTHFGAYHRPPDGHFWLMRRSPQYIISYRSSSYHSSPPGHPTSPPTRGFLTHDTWHVITVRLSNRREIFNTNHLYLHFLLHSLLHCFQRCFQRYFQYLLLPVIFFLLWWCLRWEARAEELKRFSFLALSLLSSSVWWQMLGRPRFL